MANGNSNYKLPPSVKGLRKFDVNRRGDVEVVRQSLYDFQTYPAAGAVQFLFFQVPAGQSGKTRGDTNMELAGSLPRPKELLVESIEVYFFPGVDPGTFNAAIAETEFTNDVYAVAKASCFLDFFIGSKSYLIEAPLIRFPSKTRLYVESAHAIHFTQAVAADEDKRVSTDYATFAGRPYHVDPEIRLIHTQNFSVSLNFTAAVALPSGVNARIGLVLDGVLYRLSQ